jgi:uncharacterized membrane protein YccC
VNNPLTWLGDWREIKPRVRQAVKTTIAACLAYLIADFLEMPQAFWAAVVAIFVTQANIGASLGLALDWFVGSLVGGAVGVVVAVLVGDSFALRVVGLAATVLVMAYFAAARPQMRIACVNAAIIILSTPLFGTPWESAGFRMAEVVIGTAVALLTMLLVFPARAGPALAMHVASTLPLYFQFTSDLLTMAMTGRYDSKAVTAASAKIRGAITINANLSDQAQTEVAGFLADSPDPEALLTALRRLWHTELMLARAVSEPLPANVTPLLREGLEDLRDAVMELRVEVSEEPPQTKGATPDIRAVETAVAKLNGAVASIRDSDVLRQMPMTDALRLMTLDFALEQLRQNLKDVANRSHELNKLAGSRIPWRRQLRRLLKA